MDEHLAIYIGGNLCTNNLRAIIVLHSSRKSRDCFKLNQGVKRKCFAHSHRLYTALYKNSPIYLTSSPQDPISWCVARIRGEMCLGINHTCGSLPKRLTKFTIRTNVVKFDEGAADRTGRRTLQI